MLPLKIVKRIEGKIYTILEASLDDPDKLKALKSLIGQELGVLYDYATTGESQFETTSTGTGDAEVVVDTVK